MIEIEPVTKKPRRNLLTAFFAIRAARGVADRIERKAYEHDELLVSLGNSIRQRESEVKAKRNSRIWSLLGRFSVQDDFDTIAIDGLRLQKLLDLTGEEPSQQISITTAYRLPLSDLKDCMRAASP